MGEAYSSGDCVVTIGGIFDVNPNAIKYEYNYAHEYERGLRRTPARWRMGSKDMSASITLSLDFIAKIERTFGDIAKIKPFPINISFLNNEDFIIKDFIMAKFQGNGREVTSDGELAKEYELFVTQMALNVI